MRVALPESSDDTPLGLVGTIYAPEIGAAAMEFSRVTYMHSTLSLREFEAARMITAEVNGCRLCRGFRAAADLPLYLKSLGDDAAAPFLQAGAEPDEAFYANIANWRSSDLYSPRERIAIELAERMGTEPQQIAQDDEFWKRAKAQFKDAELVDLGLCIACWMGLGRVAHVFGLDTSCPVAAPVEQAPKMEAAA